MPTFFFSFWKLIHYPTWTQGFIWRYQMICTYPERVPTFVLAREIQAPLRRLALRRQHLQRVENTSILQAAIRRVVYREQKKEEEEGQKMFAAVNLD